MDSQPTPPMNFIDSIVYCFKNYFQYRGRARRSEFWYFYIISLIIIVIVQIFTFVLVRRAYWRFHNYIYYYIICAIVDAFLFIPIMTSTIRRLHDTGRSGLYFLINFVPLGIFYLWYILALDSEQRINNYGISPKYPGASADLLVPGEQDIVPAPQIQPVQPVMFGTPQQQPNMIVENMPQAMPYGNPNAIDPSIPVANPNVIGSSIPVANPNGINQSIPNANQISFNQQTS